MAATSGLFTILPLERIAHSAASLLLATSPEFNAWAKCVTQYQFDASSKLALANERWGRSNEMKHSPFSMAFGTDMTFPEYLGQNPLMARTMGQFLSATQMIDSNSPRHLVASYDWKGLGVATIVDVSCDIKSELIIMRSSKVTDQRRSTQTRLSPPSLSLRHSRSYLSSFKFRKEQLEV